MRDSIATDIDTLECLYYLTQSVFDKNRKFLDLLRKSAREFSETQLPQLKAGVREEIELIRTGTACRVSDEEIRRVVAELLSAGEGWLYVPKSYIDRLFENYTRVFSRWPYVPMHTLVMFDSRLTSDSPFSFFISEEVLFDDVQLVWNHIQRITSDGKDFRTRDRKTQRELYTYLRLAATGAYHFLEAYVNGLAFGCFQQYHDEMALEDHDLLAEWNSQEKRTRFVSFERKIREYPLICCKYMKREIKLEGSGDVEFLVGEGKRLRDSLTHPSPYTRTDVAEVAKIRRLITLKKDDVERLLRAVVGYVGQVEGALGRKVEESARYLKPWR